MKQPLLYCIFLLTVFSCKEQGSPTVATAKAEAVVRASLPKTGVSLVVLGTVQDAGSPHIACTRQCCEALFAEPDKTRKVVSLGLVDHQAKMTFLFDATPDITEQVKVLQKSASWEANEIPNGIFLTHAHIGHYAGLMYLGKEATNAQEVTTYAMPKMREFLEQNGPWSQLVSQKNIVLSPLENDRPLVITPHLEIRPLQVPHRDEYSETVGYLISGPDKKALFIPDIDKWGKWETDIAALIKTVDYAFLDATFFDGAELNTRDISQIPHPFVIESMALFNNLSAAEKAKVHFIHFNHTNGMLNPNSEQAKTVLESGFNIAQFDQRFDL